MLEVFKERTFRDETLGVIEQANTIIEEYLADGLTLTLRQLYYQFVARGFIRNLQSEYKRLGSIINDARMAGLISWEAIEDRTRNLEKLSSWRDPSEIVAAIAQQYRIDLWETQDFHVECWIEKEALVGVIERVCNEWRVPYFACRGNVSQSEQWRAGKRFEEAASNGKQIVVLHLGDHDPSGIDMTRDNQDRLSMFAGDMAEVDVRRLALNMDQVRRYNPPSNPAKETDSRFAGYLAEYGDKSWELDALEPRVIGTLIREQIEELVDPDRWNDARDRENTEKALLAKAANDWEAVAEWLSKRKA